VVETVVVVVVVVAAAAAVAAHRDNTQHNTDGDYDYDDNRVETSPGAHPASYPMGTGIKWPGREGDH
jgi:hypothetical protein